MFKPYEFKLIVAGGRSFDNYRLLYNEVVKLATTEYADRAVSIVSGMARGADKLGHQFALTENVKVYEFPADWETHGKAAGFIRNLDMADFADGLLAFWDGQSRGTQHMFEAMRNRRKPVHIVRY